MPCWHFQTFPESAGMVNFRKTQSISSASTSRRKTTVPLFPPSPVFVLSLPPPLPIIPRHARNRSAGIRNPPPVSFLHTNSCSPPPFYIPSVSSSVKPPGTPNKKKAFLSCTHRYLYLMESSPSFATLAQEALVDSDFDSPNSRRLFDFQNSLTCIKVTPPFRDYPKLRSPSRMGLQAKPDFKIVEGEYGYILEDVPHLTDYLPDLPVSVL